MSPSASNSGTSEGSSASITFRIYQNSVGARQPGIHCIHYLHAFRSHCYPYVKL
jgi:hypothetical protein